MTEYPVEPGPDGPVITGESAAANAVKGAVRSFLIVFVTMIVPAVFNFLNEIMGWANEGGQAPFPEVSALGYAGVAAVMAALAAALTFLLRLAENATGVGILRSSLPARRTGGDH